MSRTAPGVIITGTGSYTPSTVVTNEELSKRVDTSDEWITSRTGIRERRFAQEGEVTSTMGAKAGQAAMESANIEPHQIDLIVVATLSPDMNFPSTASLIQHSLGLRMVTSFDLSAACSGFLYAVEVVSNMMRSDSYAHALVIGGRKNVTAP